MNLGNLSTETPVYDRATKEFRQTMTFRSDSVKLTGEAIGYVMEHAANTFRGILQMNGFDDYSWPPDDVACSAHADQKGAAFVFATRADKKRAIILQ